MVLLQPPPHVAHPPRRLPVARRARSQQTHIDTVLYYRQKHLTQLGGRAESIPKLAQAAQQLGPLNEAAIRAKIDAEKARAQPPPSPVRYSLLPEGALLATLSRPLCAFLTAIDNQ